MNIQRDIQLQNYNSFRTKALAKLFCEPSTVDELSEVIRSFPDERKLILGGGYNLFFTEDFNGLVIKPGMKEINLVYENNNYVEVEAGAAVEWDKLVEDSVSKGLSGLENLSLIPSSVGASPIQNIGAYGSEVRDTIVRVKTVDKQTGEIREFSNAECEFGYRDSIFKRTCRYIITSVVFRLSRSFSYKEKYIDVSRELKDISTPTISQVRNAVVSIRKRKLPDTEKLPNAGSFFKNPILTNEEKAELLKKAVDV
ncbi:MAG: UDP-N-acetylmuramate dehydrogenase, partial [Fermentimonas sp.]|nr:UDP-N-acetylmuramate dehydrogenase [Fermentimonas sp.]